jgi:adenylosuccinate lyase
MFFATLGVIASSIENVSTEIRHMQQRGVGRCGFFSNTRTLLGDAAQRTSADRKPTGLARLVRMTVIPRWKTSPCGAHISHSSVERGIGPDATVTLDFALNRLTGVVDRMLIFLKTCSTI